MMTNVLTTLSTKCSVLAPTCVTALVVTLNGYLLYLTATGRG